MHPSDDIRGTDGNALEGKRIVLCITGSVAAVRAADVARGLIRLGADVVPVMSQAATGVIHPDLMHWATGNPVVTSISGSVEHVKYAGNFREKADLVLVAPATANTIGKIAAGIDDTPVTTFVTTALGEGIPCVVVPAMHESMFRHPIVIENIGKLEKIGVVFIHPVVTEGKAKIAEPDRIIETAASIVNRKGPLGGKRVLVTAGPTVEYIDPVRIVSNLSSGKMGCAIAREAVLRGAEVTIVYGPGSERPPSSAHTIPVDTSARMKEEVMNALASVPFDVVVAAAAVSDYMPDKKEEMKIPTAGHESLDVRFVPTVKIIDRIKTAYPKIVLVAFRAVTGLTDREIVNDAIERLSKASAELIVANDISREGAGFMKNTNEVFIIDRNKNVVHVPVSNKRKVAEQVLFSIEKIFFKN
jgi:phosphopantothenoylcysteine decarboxylase/phosphopantothenate--cysteine ligase